MNENPYTVRAAIRVLDILDLLHRTPDGVTLGEAADATGLPKSSAFRYLTTLEARGYAQREPTGAYRPGLALASYHGGQLEVLSSRARPALEALRDHYDETVNLGVLDGGRVLYLEIVESRRGMRFAARPGDHEPIHCTALGKAMASTLDEDRLRAILNAEGMPQRTPRTITDSDLFMKEIQEVRRTGFALDDRENEEDGRCVAVPVVGIRVPAAVSLSAPAARFSEGDAIRAARRLREATKRIAKEIGGER